MRIGMLQATAREELVAGDQLIHDGLVGIALLAVVIDNTRRSTFAVRAESGRVLV